MMGAFFLSPHALGVDVIRAELIGEKQCTLRLRVSDTESICFSFSDALAAKRAAAYAKAINAVNDSMSEADFDNGPLAATHLEMGRPA